jgi:hypothetical protein
MQTRCRITGKELVENLVDSEDRGSSTWKFSRDLVLQCGLDDVVMLLITAYLVSFQKLALSSSESAFSCIVSRIRGYEDNSTGSILLVFSVGGQVSEA